MQSAFKIILDNLNIPDGSVLEIKNRILAANSKETISPLFEEIKTRIDLCLETQNKEEKLYYDLLRAYCHLVMGETDKAINAATHAIDGFRVRGLCWAEVIGHWCLGTIYETQKRGYLYLSEIDHATDILEPIRQEFLVKGEYEEANKCQELKSLLEKNREMARKMGTGPLHMPGTPTPSPQPASPSNDGFLHLPWIPKYHAVLASPDGMLWDEPVKEHVVFAHRLEIEGKKVKILPLAGTASTDHKITLSPQEQYGWALVEGHSMNAAHPTPICESDYILFHIHNQPQSNDIVVASRPTPSGDFAHIVKRYREPEKQLISETTDTSQPYDPLTVDQDYQILGIVIAVAKSEA